ncbi:TrkH family potassium uptake protein [Portibacter lacus]|uniref:Potassium transporter n=1 Tax=Portibacter lacus TaxID=1099794 RepID=A0AA37SLY9_9BACT|nr:potassium transporter TrkG [Portibacter lacus]GLR16891.1 potassium transporter [Portibacter lacus]
MINIQPISNVIGVLLIMVSIMMFLCIPFGILDGFRDAEALMYSGFITLGVGLVSWLYKFKSSASINKREGYLIVALGWMFMSLASSLPYIFSEMNVSSIDSLFESISGLTTTGATIFSDIEGLPKTLLTWRSLTQWIGGMGIIVLTIAIFPLLGIGGIELFVAEAPGPTSDKIHPRIQETAKRLWLLYVGLTAFLFLLLMAFGMTGFDAINHALTTMATGGFSTKNDSVAYFTNPAIHYVLILFMFLAGTNYTVIYFGLKGKFKNVWSSEEFRVYLIFTLLLILVVGSILYAHSLYGFEESFRAAAFQIVSLMTTTGFITADYTTWGFGLTAIIFILLFIGGSAGSTSGGIKIIRHLVLFKNSLLEFKRLLHPRAIIRIKMNKKLVDGKIITHILVFLLLYILLFLFGTVTLCGLGIDFKTALGAAATSLGNVGPGIGEVGPVDNFGWFPGSVKFVLAFLMLLGRLEIFTILILFTPYFWKKA